MATLSKHGEIGQIEKLDHKLAFCADRHILRNQGDGWKVWRKLTNDVNPREHYEKRVREYADKLANNPAFRHWRELMHSLIPFSLRFMVRTAISMMPDDSDGVCSEINDFACLNGGVEIVSWQEAADLCAAYRAACAEAKDKAQPTPQPA